MYNERNRSPMPFMRNQAQNGGAAAGHSTPVRDLSPEDRLEPMQPRLDMTEPRRRCDGSLRDANENGSMPDLMRGACSSPRNSMERPCPSPCVMGKCGGWGLEEHPLAMVYSPCQAWRDVYAPEVALGRGTLFSELDLPFEGGKIKRGCM